MAIGACWAMMNPARVWICEFVGAAGERLDRLLDYCRQRSSDPAGRAGHADEQHECAAAEQHQPAGRRQAAGNDHGGQRASDGDDRGGDDGQAAQPRCWTRCRSFPDRGDRRDPHGPHRRDGAGGEGNGDPSDEADDGGPPGDDGPSGGQLDAGGAEQGAQAFGETDPDTRPITEAVTPTIVPSARIEARTCRRDAPRVRRVASSLVRWATVIESVLKMMNEPTSRVIAPKASST